MVTFAAESPPASSLARQVAGALDWWREAGVDLAFADEARAWITAPELAPVATQPSTPPPRAAPPAERIGGPREAWPGSLDAFAAWWCSAAELDHGQVAGRVAPRGSAGAGLLVLVEMPEPEDRDALLSGRDGALLAAFLSAAGLAGDQVYFASVLPRSMPHPDWAALERAGLGEVLLHHLSLAAPQRILAFGGNILPLLGHDPAKTQDFSLQLNQEGPQVPVLAARELSALRARPAWKAALWRRWLDWTG